MTKKIIGLVVLTYNGGAIWEKAANALSENSTNVDKILIVDSCSIDNTNSISNKQGFRILSISPKDFNHGGTRNLGVKNLECDVVIFMTQDAILEPGAISNIIDAFDDDNVAAAYGRQLAHDDANPIATHARIFNYKPKSYLTDRSKRDELGLKTVFMSNSFSAYRVSIFNEIGGFPSNTILCEDMYFTAKAVLAGYKIAYVSEAKVKHSHNYTAIEEFKRYFDIGVFHYGEPWIRQSFGGAQGEGKKFLLSELKYLIKNSPLWIPYACLNNLFKILGYKIGLKYTILSISLRKKFSMHKRYWDSIKK